MKGFLKDAGIGLFAAVALSIVFVSAGSKGGASGGTQVSQILTAGANGISNMAKGLEQA